MNETCIFRSSLALLSIAFSAVTLLGSGENVQQPPSIANVQSFVLSPPTQQITLHEPVVVSFRMSNNGSQTIIVDLGPDRKGALSFVLTDPNGIQRRLPMFDPNGLFTDGKVSIQPGETYSQNLLLNEWYDFPQVGKYQLDASLINHGVGGMLDQRSGSGVRVLIEISPRDELALTKACNALADRVESTTSYQEAAEAALALSYVKDPVAVYYLRRALAANSLVYLLVIKGLERIANDEAVQVLAEGPKIDPADANAFRAALNHIRNQTENPEIRRQIDGILSEH